MRFFFGTRNTFLCSWIKSIPFSSRIKTEAVFLTTYVHCITFKYYLLTKYIAFLYPYLTLILHKQKVKIDRRIFILLWSCYFGFSGFIDFAYYNLTVTKKYLSSFYIITSTTEKSKKI